MIWELISQLWINWTSWADTHFLGPHTHFPAQKQAYSAHSEHWFFCDHSSWSCKHIKVSTGRNRGNDTSGRWHLGCECKSEKKKTKTPNPTIIAFFNGWNPNPHLYPRFVDQTSTIHFKSCPWLLKMVHCLLIIYTSWSQKPPPPRPIKGEQKKTASVELTFE